MSNTNQILLLAVLGTAIACFLFWNNSTGPLRSELAGLQEVHEIEREAASQRVREGRRAEQEYETLKQTVEEAEARYQSILATVPTRRDTGGLLDELVELAESSGVELTEVTPNSQEQHFSDDIAYLTTTLMANGNYQQTTDFLRGVENLNRFADIASVNINRRNDDWRDPTLATEATLNIYIYRGGNR